MTVKLKDKRQLPHAAREILKYAGEKKILAFYGAMGSGKTTLIKEICRELGSADVASSPTFTLVNEYRTVGGKPIFHIDFYRIKKQEEVFDFGVEEYLTGEHWCFMEWPELVEDILPDDMIRIRINVLADEARILTIT